MTKQVFAGRWGWLIVAGLACSAALFSGCGDDDSSSPPPPPFAAPQNARVVNGNEHVIVHWSPSPDEGQEAFKRYNVYRGTSSLLGVDPNQLEQLGNRIGSVAAGIDSFRTTVANGTLYYFHVRAEKTDGGLGAASNEVQGAGRVDGSGVILVEFAANGDSGFDFSTGLSVSLAQTNPDRFVLTDIYLGTGLADDAASGALALKSPELLTRLNGEWASRKALVKYVGTDWNLSTTAETGFSTQLEFLPGMVIAVKTPGNTYAKMKIESVQGNAGSRSITFRYAHQSTPNLIQF